MLKRHLGGHGLTVARYKEKFGLPREYPSVAPAYSERRSALAKASGLGQLDRNAKAPVKKLAGQRGRPKKAIS